MEENRSRGLPFAQRVAVVRQLSSTICKTVPQCLVHSDRAAGSVQPNGPRRCELRLGRKVQTERNAELALLSVGVLFQFCSTQVRGEINIRRLQRLPGNLV